MDETLLRRLGQGEPLASLADELGWSIEEVRRWFFRMCRLRAAPFLQVFTPSRGRVPTERDVRIERDERGIPHIMAESDCDLFFGFGWAMSEDRLWQLDFARRKALGTLSAVVGAEQVVVPPIGAQDALALDKIARIIGFGRIARQQLQKMDPEARVLLSAFVDGVNGQLAACIKEKKLPIECSLLDYKPEFFTVEDFMAIETDFRYYLSGRLPVIVLPELAKQQLGEDSELFRSYLGKEQPEEAVLPTGVWDLPPIPTGATGKTLPTESVGSAAGDPERAYGSNNWVCAASISKSGGVMVASDPHVGFEAVSIWYQAHLCGGSFDVVGMCHVGVPAIMFGRNQHVAWGITNNICSQR